MANDLKLSKLDRILLVNQLRILEALYPDEASELTVQREAVEHGYEMLYTWHYEHIYDGDDKMSEAESLEVWDTMDMFDAINRSMTAEFDRSGFPVTKFAGYDGNGETKFMVFAQYTVERLKRFQYLPMVKEAYWNSHSPMREVYQRMLEVWHSFASEKRFTLNSDQITSVLTAAIHPEQRS